MIGPAMPELELEGFATQRQTQQLVPKTDAEDRFFADELPDGFDGVTQSRWIAGTVRQKDTVRVVP
jgi:hypothetical protein